MGNPSGLPCHPHKAVITNLSHSAEPVFSLAARLLDFILRMSGTFRAWHVRVCFTRSCGQLPSSWPLKASHQGPDSGAWMLWSPPKGQSGDTWFLCHWDQSQVLVCARQVFHSKYQRWEEQ